MGVLGHKVLLIVNWDTQYYNNNNASLASVIINAWKRERERDDKGGVVGEDYGLRKKAKRDECVQRKTREI